MEHHDSIIPKFDELFGDQNFLPNFNFQKQN